MLSWPPGRSLRVGLAQAGFALIQTNRWRPHGQFKTILDQAWSSGKAPEPDGLIAEIGDALAASRCTNRPVTVILDNHWARFFMVTPPANAACLADCRAAAEMRFQALYGEATTGWLMDADWKARRPFLACALPSALGAELKAMVREHRLTLIGVVPQFVAAWNRWCHHLRGDAWFGVVGSQTLTLGAIAQQRLSTVRTIPIHAGTWESPGWLPAQLAREALRLNLPMPGRLQLCGNLPGDWAKPSSEQLACSRLDPGRVSPQAAPFSDGLTLALTGI